MSIYTKTGDNGTTSLIGGQRLKKYHPRVEAYGTVDELNACLSVAARQMEDPLNRQRVLEIQHQLFWLGAELADAQPEQRNAVVQRIGAEHIERLEHTIDRCMTALPPVSGFVLPGDTPAGSQLHLARTVARRAERLVARLADEATIRPEVLRYLNRLSDCLYALARSEDQNGKNEAVIGEVMRRYLAAAGVEQTIADGESPWRRDKPGTFLESDVIAWPNARHHDTSQSGTKSRYLTGQSNPPPPSAPLSTSDGPDFALVHGLMRAVLDAARELAVPVVISIVDPHGNQVMTYRMPDALLASLELAPKKAFSAVALKTATHNLAPAVQPGAALYQLEASMGGKIVTFGGGYPLYRAGRLVGGLGISGGTVDQDRQIAQRAITQCHVGKE
ncbi:cob(I)yrinic acid a,c-diamide adenosyltransferase [Sodalis ligni]|uniref:ATP:cob(I)alamin adenosyltransferase n=1 Tax=Sodalis ligni TaxID=2697027 RepID=A0A4R1NAH7_9GAMM|nr:ATP:cob(I)alamin adenosyltransferase [Sodalis ligni]